LMAVSASTFFTFMGRYLMSFSFFTTWHSASSWYGPFILIIRKLSGTEGTGYYYFTSTLVFTLSTKTLAGLKAGMLWAGILMVVFFEMFLPVFSALVLIIKLPKPRKYTLSPPSNEFFTSSIKVSTVA